MTWVARVQGGIRTPRVVILLKVLSVLCFLAALTHLGSILSLAGPPWPSRPILFRIADAVLLPTNLVLAWGLWRNRAWAAIGWLAAVLFLQVIPILFLLSTDVVAIDANQRGAFYGLLTTQAVLVALFLLLLPRRK